MFSAWLDEWLIAATGSSSAAAAIRCALAVVAAWLLTKALAPSAIRWLARRGGETIRNDSPTLFALQQSKAGTPTMGGLIFVAAALATSALLSASDNPYVQAAWLVIASFAMVGWIDDRCKRRAAKRGLSAPVKLLLETLAASATAGWFAISVGPQDAGLAWCAWSVFVVLASANAVNLADGLDGLAAGCWLVGAVALGAAIALTSLMTSTSDVAQPSGVTELLIVAAGMIGAVAGFLPWNRHPARIFMGDTGALPLGAFVGWLAVASGSEWQWLVIAGVFVAEALSVIVQIGCFRTTGRRVLRCAPLHHHFQFAGLAEPTIVRRFIWAAIVCAAVGVLTAVGTRPEQNAEVAINAPTSSLRR